MVSREYFLEIREKAPWKKVLKKLGITIKMRRMGPRGIGVSKCPLHQERNPSFIYYKDGGFNCFGCGADGDIFDFVRIRLGGNYSVAFRFFRKNFKIPLPPPRKKL